MPRPRYPSDDARLKQRPHVKIHHSVRGHPRFAEAFADLELRAMWTGLLLIASERHAGKTLDRVTLTRADVAWITQRNRPDAALKALKKLAHAWGYTVEPSTQLQPQHRANIEPTSSQHPANVQPTPGESPGNVVHVTIRNFAKKQGVGSASRGTTPRDSAPSESDSESDSGIPPLERGESGLTARERAALAAWARDREPWAIPHLRDLEDACLDHYRAKGESRADWLATVQAWIRRQRTEFGATQPVATTASDSAKRAKRGAEAVERWPGIASRPDVLRSIVNRNDPLEPLVDEYRDAYEPTPTPESALRDLHEIARNAGVEPDALPRALDALRADPALAHRPEELAWISRTKGPLQPAMRYARSARERKTRGQPRDGA